MAFHDVSLPDEIEYGSVFGAGFRNIVQRTKSGHRVAIEGQAQAQHRYRINMTKFSQAEASTLVHFAMGRHGDLHTWKLKDSSDHTSNDDGFTAPTALDQVIGTATGSAQVLQLFKRYDKTGPDPYDRTITLPVAGSVLVALNGTPTGAFSVAAGGLITLTGSPGAIVTSGFRFQVPAAFAEGYAKWAQLRPDDFGQWNIQDLDVIEEPDEVQWPCNWWPGGHKPWGTISQDIVITVAGGELHSCKPTAALNGFLQNPVWIPGGPRIFVVTVDATAVGSLQLRDHTGIAVGSPINAGETRQVALLRDDSGNATWKDY